ncbi:MAG: hypothetical protein P1U42_06125 [Phycisphaerales bacterium]|nr:hypothetical protein [Phycisphaerales bacterium]
MLIWIILGVLVAVLTGAITLIWWKVGDQWADDEYKKFGHGGGGPQGPTPTVISDFDSESAHNPDVG